MVPLSKSGLRVCGAWVRIPPSPPDEDRTNPATTGHSGLWRGAGVDYQARLESACSFGYRGFESHPLRQLKKYFDSYDSLLDSL